MILYKKNLKNLEQLKAEKRILEGTIGALGWDSPMVDESKIPGYIKKEKAEEAAAKTGGALGLIGIASSLFGNSGTTKFLLQQGFNLINKRTKQVKQTVKQGPSKPNKLIGFGIDLFSSYLKWKALEFGVSTAVTAIKKQRAKKKAKEPIVKAKSFISKSIENIGDAFEKRMSQLRRKLKK